MFDALLTEFDKALRTILVPAASRRPMPGEGCEAVPLGESERRQAAALMRVNHAGEICAQALYRGQALTCRDPAIRAALDVAAREETEHLNWTERRIGRLGGRKSLLNPLWYAGSLAIGMAAGKFGDDWSLGFLAETERQVEAHLSRHLAALPAEDRGSRDVIQQMQADEIRHAGTAVQLGARELPLPIRLAMTVASRIMTTTAYRI